MKKVLKKDFGKDVSLKGYRYDPKHYVYSTYLDQIEYEEEDWFREKSLEDEDKEKQAERRLRIESLDFDLVDRLYTLLIKSIKSRRLMIFNLESVPGIINNALDCYYKGVSCGASNAAMSAKLDELQAFLDNKEVIEWLKTNPTDLSFDKFDYIDTYQRVLRQITDIRNESLEYCRDLLGNIDDLWIEEIIANDYPECEAVYENCITYDSETNEYHFSEIYDDEDDYLD
jgi:hypothetical protein